MPHLIRVGSIAINLDQVTHVNLESERADPDAEAEMSREGIRVRTVPVARVYLATGDELILAGREREQLAGLIERALAMRE